MRMSDQAAPAEAGEGVGADIEREEHKIRGKTHNTEPVKEY